MYSINAKVQTHITHTHINTHKYLNDKLQKLPNPDEGSLLKTTVSVL